MSVHSTDWSDTGRYVSLCNAGVEQLGGVGVLFSRYLCSTRVKADATTAKLDGLETCMVELTGAIFRNDLAEPINGIVGSCPPPASAIQILGDYQRRSLICQIAAK